MTNTGTNILNQIAERDKERIRGYKELLEFYRGKQWVGREKWGEKRLTFNYAKVFIDKITSYLMTGINFNVEAIQDTKETRAQAERAEKAIGQVYEANNLEQLDFETEIDCAMLGDGCYKVTWEEGEVPSSGFQVPSGGKGSVRVSAPDIQGIYVWWMGDDITRVWRVASKYMLSGEEVEMLYGKIGGVSSSESRVSSGRKGGEPGVNNQTITNNQIRITKHETPSMTQTHNSKLQTVVEVWTERDFELYLDNTLIEAKPNPYGFIPFVIFPNLREPKQFWGTSDLCQLIEPQRELNRAMTQISRILELSGNPIAVLENVEESKDIAVKPGAVWNIPEDARAYVLDLLQSGGLKLHIDYIELLYRALHDISESPRAAFGGLNRDLSGIAMQIELHPLSQKLERKQAIRSTAYNRRNRMILKLLEKFRGEQPVGNEYSLRTTWGPVMPQDMDKLVINEQVMVESGIHSRKRAMAAVGVKDPGAEFTKWTEEQEKIEEIKGR